MNQDPAFKEPNPPPSLAEIGASAKEDLVLRWGLSWLTVIPVSCAMFAAGMLSRDGVLWMWVVPGVWFTLLVLAIGAGRADSRRALRRHDYLLCLRCRYPLDGLGRDGACPECGQMFRAEPLRAYWHKRYK